MKQVKSELNYWLNESGEKKIKKSIGLDWIEEKMLKYDAVSICWQLCVIGLEDSIHLHDR